MDPLWAPGLAPLLHSLHPEPVVFCPIHKARQSAPQTKASQVRLCCGPFENLLMDTCNQTLHMNSADELNEWSCRACFGRGRMWTSPSPWWMHELFELSLWACGINFDSSRWRPYPIIWTCSLVTPRDPPPWHYRWASRTSAYSYVGMQVCAGMYVALLYICMQNDTSNVHAH